MTRDQVLHVAGLARLSLSEDEVDQLVRDLDAILEHVDQLSELDTANVPPTDTMAVEALPLRDDQVVASLDQQRVLECAPQILNDGFRVPAFVED